MRDSAHGVLIPAGRALLVGKGAQVRATKLRAKHSINDAIATHAGSLLTADQAGDVNRSTDGGEKWKPSRVLGRKQRDALRCLAQSGALQRAATARTSTVCRRSESPGSYR